MVLEIANPVFRNPGPLGDRLKTPPGISRLKFHQIYINVFSEAATAA